MGRTVTDRHDGRDWGSRMVLNHGFWVWHFRGVYVPRLRGYVEALEARLLPTFDQLEAEASERTEAEWERLRRQTADPDADPADLADRAFDVGLEYYTGMADLRQGLLNLFAPALYHTWEQQLLTFHRLEVLDRAEENDHRLLKVSELRKRLKSVGVDLTRLPSWTKVQQLRLLANTVKHADGTSADHLREQRPELFEPPGDGDQLGLGLPARLPVYAPLSGQDVFVTLEHLKGFSEALCQFWEELAGALASAGAAPSS